MIRASGARGSGFDPRSGPSFLFQKISKKAYSNSDSCLKYICVFDLKRKCCKWILIKIVFSSMNSHCKNKKAFNEVVADINEVPQKNPIIFHDCSRVITFLTIINTLYIVKHSICFYQ
jgi:hypothetical protein